MTHSLLDVLCGSTLQWRNVEVNFFLSKEVSYKMGLHFAHIKFWFQNSRFCVHVRALAAAPTEPRRSRLFGAVALRS